MLSKILIGSLAAAATAQDQTAEQIDKMINEIHDIEGDLEALLADKEDAAPPAPAVVEAPPPAPEPAPAPAPVVQAPAPVERRLSASEATLNQWMKDATNILHSMR